MLTEPASNRIKFRTIVAIVGCSALGGVARGQVFDCGGVGQRYCQAAYYMNDSVITGDPYCDAGNMVVGSRCDIDRRSWQTKALDMTRSGPQSGVNCGPGYNISCWRVDDETRDQLNMNSSALNFVTQLTPGGPNPGSGRFIFVYRANDNALVIRRYDRAHTEGDPALTACLGYAQYRYSPNMRGNIYQHVRHSQLNGGWGPLYCAGEMTFKDGAVWRLNNASGHYQPPASCLSRVQDTLTKFGYQLHADFKVGPYNIVSAAENSCPSPPASDPGADDQDHDEL